MDKLKFCGGVIGFLILWYLILTISMPVIGGLADDSATEILAANATAYAASAAGVSYMPLLLYLVPGVVGLGMIVWKLRFAKTANA